MVFVLSDACYREGITDVSDIEKQQEEKLSKLFSRLLLILPF